MTNPSLPILFASAVLLPIFSQAQTTAWVQRYDNGDKEQAVALGVDTNGNVFVTGSSNFPELHFVTIKYSSSGLPLWTNVFMGSESGGNDTPRALAVDPSGNVIVAGDASNELSGSEDLVAIKYSNLGVPLWTNRCNGPADGDDRVNGLALDANGNVFVAGTVYGTNGLMFATIKYSSDGMGMWTNFYFRATGSERYLRDVATDPSGNVVVTGIDSGIRGFITIKYSGQGTALWTNTLVQGLGSGGEPEPMALAVGPTGDVYVTGKSTDHGAVTRKCSAAGSTLWTTHYKSPNLDTVYDYGAVALAVVANGDAYIAARSAPETPDDTGDYAIIKYSSGGTALWTNIYHRSDYDYPSDLAVDASGNVWVTGTTYSDYGTVAYSSAGIPLCTNIYDFGIDVASSLATDSVGNIYVTGYSRDDSGDYDFATIKYAGATATSIPLQIQSLGNQVILSWTNPAFDLQAAPTVTGAFTNISGATSPYTNSIANSQRFFRLRAN